MQVRLFIPPLKAPPPNSVLGASPASRPSSPAPEAEATPRPFLPRSEHEERGAGPASRSRAPPPRRVPPHTTCRDPRFSLRAAWWLAPLSSFSYSFLTPSDSASASWQGSALIFGLVPGLCTFAPRHPSFLQGTHPPLLAPCQSPAGRTRRLHLPLRLPRPRRECVPPRVGGKTVPWSPTYPSGGSQMSGCSGFCSLSPRVSIPVTGTLSTTRNHPRVENEEEATSAAASKAK